MSESTSQSNHAERKRSGKLWTSISRIVLLVASTLLLFGSLITFPQYTPWMLGGWLAVYFLVSRKSQNVTLGVARLVLVCILIIIACKLPEPTIALAIFVVSVIILLVGTFSNRQTRESAGHERKAKLPAKLFAIAAWLLLLASHWWGANTSKQPILDKTRPVLCVGDSLTDFGYPQELEKLINVPIEDFGFNGYTSVDGIKLIPEIVAKNPQCVVIELGGHDYKNGEPRSQTRANLIEIIDACQASGAEVVLVEIIHGFINDPYYGMERGIARQYDLQLIHDGMIRQLVFWSPFCPPGSWTDKSNHYSKDGLHPSAAGNRMMAERVAAALTKLYGPKIMASQESRLAKE